jgi:hypothetical protein
VCANEGLVYDLPPAAAGAGCKDKNLGQALKFLFSQKSFREQLLTLAWK